MTDQPRWIDYMPLADLVPRSEQSQGPPRPDRPVDLPVRVRRSDHGRRAHGPVAGHGRHDDLVAKFNADEPPPDGVTIRDDGEWLVPVQRGWASADDGEAAAYVLVSNQSTIAGGWDQEALDALTAELAANYGTALGLVHAAVEYLDHARTYRSHDTLVGRQILRAEPLKAKAVRIAQRVCG